MSGQVIQVLINFNPSLKSDLVKKKKKRKKKKKNCNNPLMGVKKLSCLYLAKIISDSGTPDILGDTNCVFIYVCIVVRIHHILSLYSKSYLVYFSCEEAEEGY